jgi:hypothetical protein
MKVSRSIVLVISVILSLSANIVFAQQDGSVAALKEQITQLEKLSRSADTPAAAKASSLRLLVMKRAQLRASLQMQIESLRRYQAAYGSRFSAKENQRVTDSIGALDSELQNLSGNLRLDSSSFLQEKGHAEKPFRKSASVRNALPESSVPAGQAKRAAPTETMAMAPPTTGSRDKVSRQSRVRSLPGDAALYAYESSFSPLSIDCITCELPDRVFVVDASTGKTYWHDSGATPVDNENRTRFSKGDRVRVIVINKNPFLFKYNISIQETTITEDALAPFFKVFSPIFPATAAEKKDVIRLADFPLRTENCPTEKIKNAKLAYESLRNEIHNLNVQIEDVITTNPTSDFLVLKRKYAPISVEYNTAVSTTFRRTKAQAGTTLCATLCSTANHLATTLSAYNPEPDFKIFQTSVEDLKAQADSINGKINEFISSYPECQPLEGGFSVLQDVQRQIKNFYKTVSSVLDELDKMRKGNEAFVKMRDTLNTLASQPDLLQEQRIIGPYNDPTNVTVKVEFRGVSAPDTDAFKPLAEAKLNFGGDKRFALSGGVAYGFLDRPEYKAILGFERDQQGTLVSGQTAPVSVVGVTDSTRRRIGPILMLNTRLTNYRDTNLFFSLGINGTSDNTGVNIDYLIGPSVNVLDRKLFLTYGLYGGRVQRLNEGLYLGLKVPDATTPEKLVRKDFVWKSGFALTYKIK